MHEPLTDSELNRALAFYSKHPYRVEIRVLVDPRKGKYGGYRTTEEFFKTEAKARKYYDRQVELHSPERDMSLCKYRGIFWMVLDSTTSHHHVWRFDEHGIPSGVFNLDKVREGIKTLDR